MDRWEAQIPPGLPLAQESRGWNPQWSFEDTIRYRRSEREGEKRETWRKWGNNGARAAVLSLHGQTV